LRFRCGALRENASRRLGPMGDVSTDLVCVARAVRQARSATASDRCGVPRCVPCQMLTRARWLDERASIYLEGNRDHTSECMIFDLARRTELPTPAPIPSRYRLNPNWYWRRRTVR
jgi:hypothetical protein